MVFLSPTLCKGSCKHLWETGAKGSISRELNFMNCKNDENWREQKFANSILEI